MLYDFGGYIEEVNIRRILTMDKLKIESNLCDESMVLDPENWIVQLEEIRHSHYIGGIWILHWPHLWHEGSGVILKG